VRNKGLAQNSSLSSPQKLPSGRKLTTFIAKVKDGLLFALTGEWSEMTEVLAQEREEVVPFGGDKMEAGSESLLWTNRIGEALRKKVVIATVFRDSTANSKCAGTR
jgi:hypothetical protein